ncbi:hypothetical protein [Enterococcus sp.]|uniref:hypothetical protein n=1 Tax=Enterococcus sp. TaxID=35783 RepID=UPI0025C714CC|nr:hypothetical protein [Enterococcus sp.]
MKNILGLFGTAVIVQPMFTLGMIGLFAEKDSKGFRNDTTSSALVEYKNNQVIITKSNQEKKRLPNQSVTKPLDSLEGYLSMLEAKPELKRGGETTTQLGQKMKHLAQTFLFTG